MSLYSNKLSDITKELNEKLWSQTEEHIKDALAELISRDLLVIEKTNSVFTQTATIDGKTELKVSQGISLIPKNFDYIKTLEAENELLKEKLKKSNE